VLREIEMLVDTRVTLLTERRARGAWGLAGGSDGFPGAQCLIIDREEHPLPAKGTALAPAGAVLRIRTPGGGGWGSP
jgi:N-methylhydantoinase B